MVKRKLWIVWTDKGKQNLRKAYDSYATYSVKSGKALKSRIFKKVKLLKRFPEMGPVQELPTPRKKQYRYLVERQYKILYWLEGNDIIIADIFDTRQDPSKLEKLE